MTVIEASAALVKFRCTIDEQIFLLPTEFEARDYKQDLTRRSSLIIDFKAVSSKQLERSVTAATALARTPYYRPHCTPVASRCWSSRPTGERTVP